MNRPYSGSYSYCETVFTGQAAGFPDRELFIESFVPKAVGGGVRRGTIVESFLRLTKII